MHFIHLSNGCYIIFLDLIILYIVKARASQDKAERAVFRLARIVCRVTSLECMSFVVTEVDIVTKVAKVCPFSRKQIPLTDCPIHSEPYRRAGLPMV